jgi:hypothetical protein
MYVPAGTLQLQPRVCQTFVVFRGDQERTRANITQTVYHMRCDIIDNRNDSEFRAQNTLIAGFGLVQISGGAPNRTNFRAKSTSRLFEQILSVTERHRYR